MKTETQVTPAVYVEKEVRVKQQVMVTPEQRHLVLHLTETEAAFLFTLVGCRYAAINGAHNSINDALHAAARSFLGGRLFSDTLDRAEHLVGAEWRGQESKRMRAAFEYHKEHFDSKAR